MRLSNTVKDINENVHYVVDMYLFWLMNTCIVTFEGDPHLLSGPGGGDGLVQVLLPVGQAVPWQEEGGSASWGQWSVSDPCHPGQDTNQDREPDSESGHP